MKAIMLLRKILKIDKYDYTICKSCVHYLQKHNKMVCMMCIEGCEFKPSL